MKRETVHGRSPLWGPSIGVEHDWLMKNREAVFPVPRSLIEIIEVGENRAAKSDVGAPLVGAPGRAGTRPAPTVCRRLRLRRAA